MANKTPYEIRLEVLKMAQDVEMQHFHANSERLMNNWQTGVETSRIRNERPPEAPPLPEFPSEDTIVKNAQFLGEFINNTGKVLKE